MELLGEFGHQIVSTYIKWMLISVIFYYSFSFFLIRDAEKFDFHGEFSSVLMDFSLGFCEMKTFELILARHLSLPPLPWSWKIHEKNT